MTSVPRLDADPRSLFIVIYRKQENPIIHNEPLSSYPNTIVINETCCPLFLGGRMFLSSHSVGVFKRFLSLCCRLKDTLKILYRLFLSYKSMYNHEICVMSF